jgi:hypothetical protein
MCCKTIAFPGPYMHIYLPSHPCMHYLNIKIESNLITEHVQTNRFLCVYSQLTFTPHEFPLPLPPPRTHHYLCKRTKTSTTIFILINTTKLKDPTDENENQSHLVARRSSSHENTLCRPNLDSQ